MAVLESTGVDIRFEEFFIFKFFLCALLRYEDHMFVRSTLYMLDLLKSIFFLSIYGIINDCLRSDERCFVSNPIRVYAFFISGILYVVRVLVNSFVNLF